MANSVDPDETARYEPSHLDHHCSHSISLVFWLKKNATLVKNVYERKDSDIKPMHFDAKLIQNGRKNKKNYDV